MLASLLSGRPPGAAATSFARRVSAFTAGEGARARGRKVQGSPPSVHTQRDHTGPAYSASHVVQVRYKAVARRHTAFARTLSNPSRVPAADLGRGNPMTVPRPAQPRHGRRRNHARNAAQTGRHGYRSIERFEEPRTRCFSAPERQDHGCTPRGTRWRACFQRHRHRLATS
jgi:hypothetical protein